MFERYRPAHPLSLPLPPFVVALLGWLVSRRVLETEWTTITSATRGLVTPAFVLSLAAAGLIVLLVTLLGRIEVDDLGLNRDHFGRGVGIVLMIWGASQVLGVLPRVVANRPVQLARDFEYGSRWEMGGQFLSALGSATAEEIAFRGFLLVQLYLLLSRNRRDPALAFAWAAVLTVIVDILASLPGVLPFPSRDLAAVHLGTQFLTGALLCWLYLQTRNLFFIIGVHALLVAPSAIVAGPQRTGNWFHPLVIAILASLWGLLWPRRD